METLWRGELTGAIISGKDSAEIIKELNQSSILPFTSFFYRKHFVILFDKEQVKNHFEQLLLLYKSQGYIFYSSTLYDDHWSQVLEGTEAAANGKWTSGACARA
ncbi:hypothetical protein AAAC51_04240 [Priestia megaterium]